MPFFDAFFLTFALIRNEKTKFMFKRREISLNAECKLDKENVSKKGFKKLL